MLSLSSMGKMPGKKRVQKQGMADLLTCFFCSKIQRDSTSITECIHTFCKKCITKKITEDELRRCPICQADLGVHPLEKLRPDHNLQSLAAQIILSTKIKTKKSDFSDGEAEETETLQGEEEEEEEEEPVRKKVRSLSSFLNAPNVSCETLTTGRSRRRKSLPKKFPSFVSSEQPVWKVENRPQSSISPILRKNARNKKQVRDSSNYIIIDDDDEDEEEEEKEEAYKPAHAPPVSVARKKKPRGRPKKSVVAPPSEGAKVSAQALINCNASERRLGSIWLQLVATFKKDNGPPLPQINPSFYLRIKDIRAPVSFLKQYLVTKLNLLSEEEVDIELQGLRLPDDMELWYVMDLWGQAVASSEMISTTLGSSGKDSVMVLSYSRKS